MRTLSVFGGSVKSGIDLKEDDYDLLEENYNIIETYYKAEQLLYILLCNYNEFCTKINSITLKNFFEGSIEKEISVDITDVNWKLLNLSASFRCYIDQILGSQKNQGLFENIDSSLHKSLKEKYDYYKKNNPDARYLYSFRNEIQHNSLPMQLVGLSHNIVGKENKKTRIINMTFNEELANKDYVKIGNGLQSLFDIHYDIIRKKFCEKYISAKKDYLEFFDSNFDSKNCLIALVDGENEDDIKRYSRKYINSIEILVNKNPSNKPKVQGWFPGIINIADIENSKKKL